MTHYLKTTDAANGSWWSPKTGEGSPLIDSLVREHWDRGPFAQIETWVSEMSRQKPKRLIELGCGVGGLFPRLRSCLSSYLGVDGSFSSIALARHLALGAPYPRSIGVPEDLLGGPTSRRLKITPASPGDGSADFVVGDFVDLPLAEGKWDLSLALNLIDMLPEPSALPESQHRLLKSDGTAIQSCPYVWHPEAAKRLRAQLPKEVVGSSRAVERLYEKAGFKIQKKIEHLPWLFFKHARQLEIYSVHLFLAQKSSAS